MAQPGDAEQWRGQEGIVLTRTYRVARATRGWVRLSGLAMLLAAAPAVVRAEGPPSAPPMQAGADEQLGSNLDEEARQRFELGRALYQGGRFQQAADEFSEAYRLSKRPQLLYNLYVANRDAGRWPEATDALREYLARVPDAPDRVTLRARLESMEAQVERQRAQEAEATARAASEASQPRTRTEVVHSNVPWLLVGSGGALLLGSIATGIVAKHKNDDLDGACADEGKVCPASREGDVDRAYRLAVSTDVLWSVGAAAAVTGLVLWYTGALDQEHEVPVASIAPSPHGFTTSLAYRY